MFNDLDDFIYSSPTWLSSGVFVAFGIIGSGVILLVATRLIGAETRHQHNEFTLFTVTNIAVFYAVLLAFIAIAAWEDLGKAGDIVDREAVLVESLALDAQGLDDKAAVSTIETQLHHYVETVINQEWPEQQAGRVSKAAGSDLHKIRSTLARVKLQVPNDAIVKQEMLKGLNELFTAYHERLEAAAGHIPSSLWWVIIFLTVLAVGFTALLGMRNLWMHFLLLAGFTTTIVIVVTLIVQLDYPFRGYISVSDDPFQQALSELGTPGMVR